MSFTVVPIHNLKLEPGTRVPFGNGFVLQDVPGWLKNDREILNDLSRHERLWTLESQHAWVAEYDALSIGEPDPSWKGSKPKSIQQTKFDSVILANIALWLMEPTNVCFTNGFDAISWNVPERPEKLPIAQQVQPCNRLLCHPKDVGNRISVAKIVKAGDLHAVLFSIPRDNAVWESLRATWAALTMNSVDLRYSLFWIGLEALFGADDAGEIGYKLAQRISFFLADTPKDARNLFRKVKICYSTRSKIIHGRWKNDPKIDEVMADTEAIVRTVFRRLLDDREILNVFVSKQRDFFLEDWVFSRSTDPPPVPKP